MHIGLIGGIGPAATIAYYEQIIRAFQSVDLAVEITIGHADVRAMFFSAGSKMVGAQNANAVLLAGTDLGLAFDWHDPG